MPVGQTLGVQIGSLAEMSGREIIVSHHLYLKHETTLGHPWMGCSISLILTGQIKVRQ